MDKGDSEHPTNSWRHGPAKYWYDKYGIPEDAVDYDKAMKEMQKSGSSIYYNSEYHPPSSWVIPSQNVDHSGNKCEENSRPANNNVTHPEEAFYLVSQLEWEKDVVWDAADIAKEKNVNKAAYAGWIPLPERQDDIGPLGNDDKDPKKFEPLLYCENPELVNGRWEDDVIWDAEEERHKFNQPKMMVLNPNDENLILNMPPDVDVNNKVTQSSENPSQETIPPKYLGQPQTSKVTKLLKQLGVRETVDPEAQEATTTTGNNRSHLPKIFAKNPFNISNDEYYEPKSSEDHQSTSLSAYVIEHPPVLTELQSPFIPTHLDTEALRNFHRPPVFPQKYKSATVVGTRRGWRIISLTNRIQAKREQAAAVLETNGSFAANRQFMASALNLSGRDGELLLIENCEEYPPLLSQVGMCSNIINYCQRTSLKVKDPSGSGEGQLPQDHQYGETKLVRTSPFLGTMHPGQIITTLENNLYRCPIYSHSKPTTDFLLIFISKGGCLIREYDSVFTAGQHAPLYEVPVPNSSKAKQFLRDFIMVFCYRSFLKRKAMPRSFDLNDVLEAFPLVSETTIRKWLKTCADFKKEGNRSLVVLKEEFLLPHENDLQTLVTPEKCCAYFSLLAGEQRLKDAGYSSEKCLFAAFDDDFEKEHKSSSSLEEKLEDEVKNAPWNTTSAYLQATKGKCLLQVTGPADPTGCGEGFSYVRLAKKSGIDKEQRRTVKGTDSDLRRLSVTNGKNFLRKIGVTDVEIKKLTRWEIIDLVRTVSTEKTRAGETAKVLTKYSRVKLTASQNLELYKSECQRIFDLQNKVLSSKEVLSSDDDEGNENTGTKEESIEAMGRNIEQILNSKADPELTSHEQEEIERLELRRMMLGDDDDDGEGTQSQSMVRKKDDDVLNQQSSSANRVLKIVRTFKSSSGKKDRCIEEIVKNPDVINAYIKIRTRNSEETIRKFAQKLNAEEKGQLREKKRRIQERTWNSNQEKIAKDVRRSQKRQFDGDEYFPNQEARKKAAKRFKMSGRKCGACGSLGHFRTSKDCPMYDPLKVDKSNKKRKITGAAAAQQVQGFVVTDEDKINVATDLIISSDSGSDTDDTSSSNEETSESGSDSESERSSSHESEVVRVEGTKLVLRLSHEDILANSQQLYSEENPSTPNQSLSRSRVSQAEREQSDYLSKQYKTTAADRQARSCDP